MSSATSSRRTPTPKCLNEHYASQFAGHYGREYVGLRYFNVFGQRQDPEGAYAAVIPKRVSAMIKTEPIYINGTGKTRCDFCYLENVVQMNVLRRPPSGQRLKPDL